MPDDEHDDTVIRVRRAHPDQLESEYGVVPAGFPRLPFGDGDADIDADTIVPLREPATRERSTADSPPIGIPPDGLPPARSSAPASSVRESPVAGAQSSAGTARYRFSLNGGRAIVLDIPTILGRNPRSARIAGAVSPRLIAVDSPLHEVSGSHVELAQQGSAVVVTDLRSTNGTIVTLPNAERVQLRPGASFVTVPGSLVDIGDGNTIEVLGVERLLPDLAAWTGEAEFPGIERTP